MTIVERILLNALAAAYVVSDDDEPHALLQVAKAIDARPALTPAFQEAVNRLHEDYGWEDGGD